MSQGQSCLVLGASGIVGQPLCLDMLARGWTVYGAARFGDHAPRTTLDRAGVHTVVFDLHEHDPIRLPDVDVVFLEVWDRGNAMNPHDLHALWRLNYDGLGRIVHRYAGNADIVNGSTISLYGPRTDRPSRESDFPAPDTQYGLSRLAQERLFDFLCDRAGSRVVHLRYARSNRPDFGVIRRYADTILRGDSLGALPDQRLQVIGLQDFVRCTAEAAERIDRVPRHVHVVHPRVWTQRELADRLQAGMGRGVVHFEREIGGAETSLWADPTLMIRTFGPPKQNLDALIDDVCADAVAHPS